MIKLSKRLSCIASMTENAGRLADIGTDHGYLPIYFAMLGRAEKITASDIKEGPLSKAKEYAERYGVSDKIEFRLADGLDGFETDYNTVIIAGMGGESIVSILEKAPWTKEGADLILQPQSKIDVLLPWLDENGYMIKKASAAKDRNRLYLVFSVTGGRGPDIRTPGELYLPRELLLARDPLAGEYIRNLSAKLRKALNGIEKAENEEETFRLKSILEDLSEMEKETETW